jgi:hypothetical protein
MSAVIMDSCSRNSSPSGDSSSGKSQQGQTSLASCIIYKTRSDYSRNIPVTLSEDKTKIVSYPDVKDVYYNGELACPAKLEDGFLLDNRGIGPNVAFLSFTYEEYSKLGKTPSSSELYEKIVDKDPLTEMYRCGNRNEYKNLVGDLNRIILEGKLESFTRLK